MSIINASNMLNQKTIYDITPFTTTDFADHLSCIVWFAQCNMRCVYCYNDHIVDAKEGNYSLADLLSFLKSREGLLDGVVLSGGEATLQDLVFVCEEIKKLKYKIKLDTNGLNPNLIQDLLDKKLIDFVSLDYKSPQNKFKSITKNNAFEKFECSLKSLINSQCDFEVRTTVHNDLLSVDDINSMIKYLEDIAYEKVYYIQHFLETASNIGNIAQSDKSFNKDALISKKLDIVYRNEIALT